MMNIEQEIQAIHERNRKVEGQKARETSGMRRGAIALLTYLVVVLFFLATGFSDPFLNALVPTCGFLLSTLTLAGLKRRRKRAYLVKQPVYE